MASRLDKETMNYELCKKLKELGFSQELRNGDWAYFTDEEDEIHLMHDDNDEGCFVGNDYSHRYEDHPVESWIKVPTLSELIKACDGKYGQRFRWLGNEKTHWSAQARPTHSVSKEYPGSPIPRGKMGKDIKAIGKTPEESVANLWLALQTKK